MNKTMISNVLLIWHYNRVHFLKVYLSVFWNMKVYFIKYISIIFSESSFF